MGIEMMIAGTILNAASTMMGAFAQRGAAQYQAQVAKNNAKIAEMNARYAEQQGVKREQEEVWKVRDAYGQQAAGFAASGIAGGTQDDVLRSTAKVGARSIGNVRDSTAREAYGYRVQGWNFETEEAMARHRASQAIPMGIMGTASTLLGGAASTANRWSDMQRTGGANPSMSLVR